VTAPIVPKKLQLWGLHRLKPYDRNPRTHTPAQVAKIVASIRRFGFTNPILAAADGTVIAGHARLAAARELGLVAVPVIQLEHLDEAERRAYVIADNRLALEAGWDPDILQGELKALQEVDFNLELTGFDQKELDRLLGQLDEPLGAEPEPRHRAAIRVTCLANDVEAVLERLRRAAQESGIVGIEIKRA
jgi:ParB-like chromosome segregation protein Spo0J